MYKKIIIAVICIIIVALGVYFFIFPKHTNNGFYLDDTYYGKNEFIDISSEELSKLDNNSFVIFTYNNFCSFPLPCDKVFEEFMKKYNVAFLSIPFEDFKETSYYDEVKFGPSVILVHDGKIVDYLKADSDEDVEKYQDVNKFGSWIKQYINTSK